MNDQPMRIEGHPQYIKVGHAIINTDKTAYEQWLVEQKEKKSLVDRINRLELMVEQLLNKKD